MNGSAAALSNPFSTARTRPGEIPYVFPADASLDGCLQRLANARRLQLVGPHGSGKSTLVRHLLDAWEAAGGAARLLRIGPGGEVAETLQWGDPVSDDQWLCVDGWEQWPLWRRWLCRLRAARLLVTAHRTQGWPELPSPRPTADLACRLARDLQRPLPAELRLGDDAVRDCFRDCEGNIRETLFALYDEFERRRP